MVTSRNKSKDGQIPLGRDQAIRSAYQAGFVAGRAERQTLLNTLCSTNVSLWKEMLRLDREQPLEGVLLSFSFAEEILKALRSPGRKYKCAGLLAARIKNASRSLHELVDALESHEQEKLDRPGPSQAGKWPNEKTTKT